MNSDSLDRVNEKLVALNALYERLKVTRAKHKEAVIKLTKPDANPMAVAVLSAGAHLLHVQCGKALDDLQAAYAAMKFSDSTGGSQ